MTIVENTGGSLWARNATTLTPIVSIGVAEGDDVYMLGRVAGLAADGEWIYVVDSQVPTLRAYGSDGEYVRTIGSVGAGPGEYLGPDSVAVGPAGEIFVRDPRQARILIYSADGHWQRSYRSRPGLYSSSPLIVTPEGHAYSADLIEDETHPDGYRFGMSRYGPDGRIGESILPPEPAEAGVYLRSECCSRAVPFAAAQVWALTPLAGLVAGTPSRYSFEAHGADGHVTRVSKYWEPVVVQPSEADWHRRATIANFREMEPGWRWNGPEVPSIKPAYDEFIPLSDGTLWVIRQLEGSEVTGCTSDPEPGQDVVDCWKSDRVADAFGTDGRFLGEIQLPPGLRTVPRPVVAGDAVWAVVEDDAGVVRVTRFAQPR